MPPDPAPAWHFGAREGLLTMLTALRHHGHDFVHLLDRQQCAVGPPVSRLAAPLPAGGGAFGRGGAWGGSDEGGRDELDESCPRRASSSRTRSCKATFSARSATFSARRAAFSRRS